MAIAATLGKARQPAARRSAAGGAADPAESAVRRCGSQRQPDLGVNFFSGAFNQSTGVSTGQLSAEFRRLDARRHQPHRCAEHPAVPQGHQPVRRHQGAGSQEPAGDAGRAEPAGDQRASRPASWPAASSRFPWCSGGASVGTVTIMFREFGVRLNFLPTVTPRGTIRLQVAPEVSSLDYTNAVTLSGLHHSGALHAPRADRSGTGERPELRDRRAAGQPDHREP